MSSPDEKLKTLVEEQLTQAKQDHQQEMLRLENELRAAKSVEKEKEDLLEKLQKLEQDIGEKANLLQSGPIPVYNEEEDPKISQLHGELTGMQNENVEMKMKLTQYEEDVSTKTHEL